jgi:mannose-6-phosphate isomerase
MKKMEQIKYRVLPIAGKVQHYAWGGYSYLPNLLKIPMKNGETYAEYWLGTHDRGSATIEYDSGTSVSLKEYIEAYPDQTLGEKTAKAFGRIPFLLKILDVRDMLSIQVHPALEDARQAFEAENKRGVSLEAAERNFKDDNHKPELMLALDEFWLLHGFKTPSALQHVLQTVPELNFLIPIFGDNNYRKLYQYVMEMPQEQVDRHLKSLVERIVPLYKDGNLNRGQEDFWAARAAITYSHKGSIDRGIFSVYFFNLVHLRAGQAVFQDTGLPHAYLEGQNVEIMANSDNVLRGGLTPKHIDAPELLKHVRFEPTIPHILNGEPDEYPAVIFKTTAPDFELGLLRISKGEEVGMVSKSVGIFLLFSGSVEILETNGHPFRRGQGESWVSFDGAAFRIRALQDAVIYRASIPGKY